jgi:hypothetical protein
MSIRESFVPAICLALFAGCSPAGIAAHDEDLVTEDSGVVGPDTAETLVDGEVASVAVHARTLKLTFEPTATPIEHNGARAWRLRGKSSRNLTDVFSFVFDDPFGQATLTGKRAFEIVLSDGHELNSILSGAPLFFRVITQTGATKQYTARVDLAPALARFSGSSALWIHRDVRPVYLRDDISNLRYRGEVDSSKALDTLQVITDDDADPEVRATGTKSWAFDWEFATLSLAADPPTDPVLFVGEVGTTSYEKEAGLDVAISRLGLSVHDAEATWPTPACDDGVWSCILAHAPVATGNDLAECGLYREVTRCLAERGDPNCSELGLTDVGLTSTQQDAEAAAADSCRFCTSLDVQAWGYACSAAASMEAIVDGITAARAETQQQSDLWSDIESISVQTLRDDLAYHQIAELEQVLPGSLDEPGVDVVKLWGGFVPTQPNVDGALNLYVIHHPGAMQAISIYKRDEYP